MALHALPSRTCATQRSSTSHSLALPLRQRPCGLLRQRALNARTTSSSPGCDLLRGRSVAVRAAAQEEEQKGALRACVVAAAAWLLLRGVVVRGCACQTASATSRHLDVLN